MQDTAYGPVNTTIRVHEGYLLNKTHYDRMLNAPDYETAVRVLQDTVYREGVDKAVLSRNYEDMLMEELKKTYNWVTTQSPNHKIIELITLAYAYHNIETLFKEEITGKEFSHTLIEIGQYPTYEYRRAINLRRSDILPDQYVDSINLIHSNFDDMPSLDDLDVYLDRLYFDHMRHLAKEIDNKEVIDYINHTIDLNNLAVFLRAFLAGNGPNHIQSVLADGGQVSIEYYLGLMTMTYEQIVTELGNHPIFRKTIDQSRDEHGQLSLSQLERNIDIDEIDYLAQADMKVFGPLPMIAFLNAKEVEVRNIRLILTSKINSIDPAIVRDRVRLNYAI